MNLQQYFERIGYKGDTQVSIETLKALHTAQVFSIPFENLAIHESQNVNTTKDIIHLDENALFKKLITDKRGGYCHENNELFALALTQLGFKVDRLAARVLTAPNLPRGHKLLMITIDDQKYLADVGFGGYGLFEPIPLKVGTSFKQYGDEFKLDLKDGNFILQILEKDIWKNLYEFTLETFKPVDFEQMSYNVSHHPKSIFVTNRICVMPRPEGRIILNNMKLKMYDNGSETYRTLQDEKEYAAILQQYFGIKLPKDTKLKAVKEIAATNSQTNAWFNYFTRAAIIAGMTGAVYVSKHVYGNKS